MALIITQNMKVEAPGVKHCLASSGAAHEEWEDDPVTQFGVRISDLESLPR